MDILYHTPAVRAGENRMLRLDLNHASNGKDSIVTHDQKRSSRRVLVMTMRSNNHDLRIVEICAFRPKEKSHAYTWAKLQIQRIS